MFSLVIRQGLVNSGLMPGKMQGPALIKIPSTPVFSSVKRLAVKGSPNPSFSNLLDLTAATLLQPSGPFILVPKTAKPVTFCIPLIKGRNVKGAAARIYTVSFWTLFTRYLNRIYHPALVRL